MYLNNKKLEIENFLNSIKDSQQYIKIEFGILILSYILFISLFIHSYYVTLTFPIIEFFALLICKTSFHYRKHEMSLVIMFFSLIYIINSFIKVFIFNKMLY